jgi:hypothetical protein
MAHADILPGKVASILPAMVISIILSFSSAFSVLAQTKSGPPIPRLEKQGQITQLFVDGRPFLVLGGELRNSSSSNLEYMRPIWPRLVKMRLNTVLAVVSWEQIEPAEGKFDFTVVDGLIRDARRNNLRLILLWFGSWKNGTSRYPADWVKANQERFPRVRNKDGKTLEILSTLSEASREADARAFAALMRHVREVDSGWRTVIMIQVQNEVGVLGDSRDRCAAADEAFGKPVPKELMDYLQKHKDLLLPELRKVWEAAGAKSSGTWEQVFSKGVATDEIFMAWNYARYIGRITELGKAEYPLPMFVNAWIVQPEDKGPGDYPSGGPVAHVHDVWRAGAPQIDILAPDIYLPDFPGILAQYSRSANPVFIPESRGDAGGVANAFYAIGQLGAIGYSPFGIDNPGRLVVLRPDPNQPAPTDIENLPLPQGYSVLSQLAPLILEHQAKGSIDAAWLNKEKQTQKLSLGNYTLEVDLRRNRRAPNQVPELGYCLAIALGPDEYVVTGSDVQVTFSPNTAGPPIAGLLSVEEGIYADGRWIAGRRLNGDEVQLRYDLSEAAAINQSAAGLRFGPGAPGIQRVKLYRYR